MLAFVWIFWLLCWHLCVWLCCCLLYLYLALVFSFVCRLLFVIRDYCVTICFCLLYRLLIVLFGDCVVLVYYAIVLVFELISVFNSVDCFCFLIYLFCVYIYSCCCFGSLVFCCLCLWVFGLGVSLILFGWWLILFAGLWVCCLGVLVLRVICCRW